jgi:hypothetical protein
MIEFNDFEKLHMGFMKNCLTPTTHMGVACYWNNVLNLHFRVVGKTLFVWRNKTKRWSISAYNDDIKRVPGIMAPVNLRRKPIIPSVSLTGIQWLGYNIHEIIDFIGRHDSVKHLSWAQYVELVQAGGLKVLNNSDDHFFPAIGEWVCRDTSGKFVCYSQQAILQQYDAVYT